MYHYSITSQKDYRDPQKSVRVNGRHTEETISQVKKTGTKNNSQE